MKISILDYKNFRAGSAWIILIMGIALYGVGYFYVNDNSIWKEILIKLGDVLVIGVILGYLSNASQFLGIFKKDLQDIIYGKEFLRTRTDIQPLWDNISKELFKNKFPKIHKDLLDTVSGYLPKDEVSFYDDYEAHLKIEWQNKDMGIISVTDEVEFTLIAETDNEFTYPLKTWTSVKNQTEYYSQLLSFSVNSKQIALDAGTTSYEDGRLCTLHKFKLRGHTKYEIKYSRKKIYNINEDYYIGFRAHYIVNKLRVSLEHPEDISAEFICRGTAKDFIDAATPTRNKIEKKYKGIILPRQGYIFALKTNVNNQQN